MGVPRAGIGQFRGQAGHSRHIGEAGLLLVPTWFGVEGKRRVISSQRPHHGPQAARTARGSRGSAQHGPSVHLGVGSTEWMEAELESS